MKMQNKMLNLIGVQCITTAICTREMFRFILFFFLKKANPSEKIANFTQLYMCSLAGH